LLERGAPLGVNQLFRRYRRAGARTIRTLIEAAKDPRSSMSFEESWMLKYARPVPVRFIGVFDTVGALGVPFQLYRRLKGEAYPFLNTGLRQNDEYAFHALAIDEHRQAFAPTLWTDAGATDAKPRPIERTEQRWFVGAHANVGGGCFDDPLAQLPLQWLMQKAGSLGLVFDLEFAPEPDAYRGTISDSFWEFAWGLYALARLGRRYYRPIGVPPPSEGPGVTNINETIDGSVFARWRTDPSYRPPGLEGWATRNGVDPAKIATAVRADAPSTAVA
jgi:hypothetical protein